MDPKAKIKSFGMKFLALSNWSLCSLLTPRIVSQKVPYSFIFWNHPGKVSLSLAAAAQQQESLDLLCLLSDPSELAPPLARRFLIGVAPHGQPSLTKWQLSPNMSKVAHVGRCKFNQWGGVGRLCQPLPYGHLKSSPLLEKLPTAQGATQYIP